MDRSKRFTLFAFPGRHVHSDTNSASPGSILVRQQLRAKTKSLTCPPLSVARYSFIQLSQLGPQWRERKCPIFETVAKGDSNPGSLDCESGILPLSYRAPLNAYAGHKIPVCGQINVSVSYQEQSGVFPLVVVDNDGPPLLDRNWLNKISLNWHEIFAVSETESVSSVSSVLNRHQAVFKPGLGTIIGHKADIQVKDGVSPVFCEARPVPYAVKEKVDREIERLEHDGVIKKVETSEWASPIVCVPKRNGSIRICGDFKVSVNPVLISNPYPLPNTEHLFATLAGGEIFSKLDLSNAYQQLELTGESQKYPTINTHIKVCMRISV